jgi:hypothetical protein
MHISNNSKWPTLLVGLITLCILIEAIKVKKLKWIKALIKKFKIRNFSMA